MKTMALFSILLFSLSAFSFDGVPEQRPVPEASLPGGFRGECYISNPDCTGFGSKVIADVAARCMCIGRDCFRISIGYGGPTQTVNGTSTLGPVDNVFNRRGGKYRTYQTSNINRFDDDAISMGIGSNVRTGKWIHKTRRCEPGGRNNTAGCIAVPCKYWALMKAQMGQRITVCGGRGASSSYSANYAPPALGPQIDYAVQLAESTVQDQTRGTRGTVL